MATVHHSGGAWLFWSNTGGKARRVTLDSGNTKLKFSNASKVLVEPGLVTRSQALTKLISVTQDGIEDTASKRELWVDNGLFARGSEARTKESLKDCNRVCLWWVEAVC